MPSRPLTRRRKPGTLSPKRRNRQLLTHSESATVPIIASELELKNIAQVKTIGNPAIKQNHGSSKTVVREQPVKILVRSTRRFRHREFQNPAPTENARIDSGDADHGKRKSGSGDPENKQINILKMMLKVRKAEKEGFEMTHWNFGIKGMTFLDVPTPFIFDGTGSNLSCTFKIKNTSKHHISYTVETPNPVKFEIEPNVGLICPHSKAVVRIKTYSEAVNGFDDIANDTFKVLGLPIMLPGSHFDHKTFKSCWKMYESDKFPAFMAEVHNVNKLILKSSEHFSILNMISFTGKPECKMNVDTFLTGKDLSRHLHAPCANEWDHNKHMICIHLMNLGKCNAKTDFTDKSTIRSVVRGGMLMIGASLIFLMFILKPELPLPDFKKICDLIDCPYYFGIQIPLPPPPPPTWHDHIYQFCNKMTCGWACQQ